MLQYELTGTDPLVLHDLAAFTVAPKTGRAAGRGIWSKFRADGCGRSACSSTRERLVAEGVSVSQVADAIGAGDQAEAAGRVDRGVPAVRHCGLRSHQRA